MNLLRHYWQGLSPALRRYYRASVLPSLLFLTAVVLHEVATTLPSLALPLRYTLALLPALCLAWMFAAYLRFLSECDELERRIELAALAWAAGIAMHTIVAALYLLDAQLVPWPAKDVVACVGVLLFGSYALIRAVLHRRYA